MKKIIEQHVQLDKEAKTETDLRGTAYSYGYDAEYQKRHLKRIEKKLEYINSFLVGAEERKGLSGEEVKLNITDNQSAMIKGAHGYIQGRCPAGKQLCYKGHVKLNRNSGEKYQAKIRDCKDCPLQQQCIASRGGKSPKRTLYRVDRSGEENRCGKMRDKIDEGKYRVLYGRRMQIIEPYFQT